jgi:hypothetical protein
MKNLVPNKVEVMIYIATYKRLLNDLWSFGPLFCRSIGRIIIIKIQKYRSVGFTFGLIIS